MSKMPRRSKRKRTRSMQRLPEELGYMLMIRCRNCHQEVVISSSDRVYAIEDGKLGSPTCMLVMSRPVGHLPDIFLYNEDEDVERQINDQTN